MYVSWLPPIKDYVGAPGPGAKGIRPYGRLIYEYSENKERIRKTISTAFDSLNKAYPGVSEWRIYLICGLSGGTGSGMFLPLSFDLENWHIFRRDVAGQKFRAFFILPPLQITGRHDRYHANAFAALRELNYYAISQRLPYNNTYLLEPINAAGDNIGLDNLPLLIAQRLLLNIQGGAAAQEIDAMMDNEDFLGGIYQDDARRRHAQCFSSFGLASVSYPREIIARSIAQVWGSDVVGNWLSERDASKNVNAIVRSDLPRMHLSRLHVNGDGDPFEHNDYPAHETQLPSLVDADVALLHKKQLGPAGHRLREKHEHEFRGLGIDEFYQQRERDAERAACFAIDLVRLNVSRVIRDPQRGAAFARDYLDELVKILDGELRPDAAVRSGDAALRQLFVLQANYADTMNSIALQEQKTFYFNARFERNKANMSDDLKAYVVKKASFSSAKYATNLLDHVIPKVKALRAGIDVWQARVTELQDKIEAGYGVCSRASPPRRERTGG